MDEVDAFAETVLGPGEAEDGEGDKTVHQEHGDVESSLTPVLSPGGFGSEAGWTVGK